jgi:chemotaxis protein CheD
MTERRVHVVQGEFQVTSDPNVVLTTILGSCVAACICDPVAQVGGMNHFLLPGTDTGGRAEPDAMRYGVYSMELLLNALYRYGAKRERLEVKLFGGARMIDGLTDIGNQNATFAERFLRSEGIQVLGGSLRGEHGRRIQYWPVTGRVRQMAVASTDKSMFETERRQPAPAAPAQSGAVELF